MLFYLSDEAVMAGRLGIRVEQAMQIRRGGDQQRADPEKTHQPGRGGFARHALTL